MAFKSVTKKLLPEFRYDSSTDVSMRLKDTIVSYNGSPCLVQGPVDPSGSSHLGVHGLEIFCVDLKTLEEFVCHSSDELLDITSLPLGWCVHHGEEGYPVYLMRTTRSSQRQGVHPPALDVLSPVQPDKDQLRHGYSYRRHSDLSSLARFSTGETIPIRSATSRRYGAPLNKDWALVNPRPDRSSNFFTIYHKHIEVGTYRADRREFFFRRDRLTKTRRTALEELFANPINKGAAYGIVQQA